MSRIAESPRFRLLLLAALSLALLIIDDPTIKGIALVTGAVLSAKSPRSALSFLAASPLLPSDEIRIGVLGSIMPTPTTVALIAAAATVFWHRQTLRRWGAIRGGLVPVALFTLWVIVSSVVTGDPAFLIELAKCLTAGYIALWLHRISRNTLTQTTQDLLIGLSVSFALWALVAAGLGPGLRSYTSLWGFSRLSLPRQDPNATAVVFAAIFGGSAASAIRPGQRISVTALFALVALFALFAVVLTASRGGFLNAALLLGAVMFAGLRSVMRSSASYVAPISMGLLLVLSGMTLLAFSHVDLNQLLARVTEIPSILEERGLDTRATAAAGAMEHISSHPWFGIGLARYFTTTLSVGSTAQLAHNTFLDVAASAGTPAALLWAVVVLSTPLKYRFALPRWHRRSALPLFLMYCACLVGMMSLSMPTDKLLWVLFFLLLDARNSSHETCHSACPCGSGRWRMVGTSAACSRAAS